MLRARVCLQKEKEVKVTNITVQLDLSRYTVQELNSLYLEGILTKEEYDAEIEERQLTGEENGTDQD